MVVDPGFDIFGTHPVGKGDIRTEAIEERAKLRPHLETCGGHGQKLACALVPADKPQLFVEDAKPLVDMLQRGADQAGLIVKDTVTLLPFHAHDVGHIGLQDHRATIGRAVFRDLHPAAPDHAHVEDQMLV